MCDDCMNSSCPNGEKNGEKEEHNIFPLVINGACVRGGVPRVVTISAEKEVSRGVCVSVCVCVLAETCCYPPVANWYA
jgi:hypothetical protein